MHWLRILIQLNRTLWYATMLMQVSRAILREMDNRQTIPRDKREDTRVGAHQGAKGGR